MNLESGQDVGSYKLLFPLRRQENSELWAAKPTVDSGAPAVALKLLKRRYGDGGADYTQTARTVAGLEHEGLLRPIDYKQSSTSITVASELIQGPSLASLLQRLAVTGRHPPTAITAHIGSCIGSVLDLAEGHKLTHGHLSPHNILIDRGGNVRLSDLGVVPTDVVKHPTKRHELRGKPNYMSPEQVSGGVMDTRSDLFSLGIILYETASLHSLFGRPTVRASFDAVLNHAARPLPELVRDFPLGLWAVIERCIQRKPEDRFQTVREFLEALEAAASDVPEIERAPALLGKLVGAAFPPNSFEVGHLALQGEEDSVSWPTTDSADPLAPKALQEVERKDSGDLPPQAPSEPKPIARLQTELPDASPAFSDEPISMMTGTGVSGGPVDKILKLFEDEGTRNIIIGGVIAVLVIIVLATALSGPGDGHDQKLRELYEAGQYEQASSYFVQHIDDFAFPETAFGLAADARNFARGVTRVPRGASTAGKEPALPGAGSEGESELEDPSEAVATGIDFLPPEGLPNGGEGARAKKAREALAAGLEAHEQGQLKQAIRSYQKCLRAAELPTCHRQLGLIYQQQDKTTSALRHYQRYLGLVPKAPDADSVSQVLRRLQSLR